jgi:hypothetical protein
MGPSDFEEIKNIHLGWALPKTDTFLKRAFFSVISGPQPLGDSSSHLKLFIIPPGKTCLFRPRNPISFPLGFDTKNSEENNF